MADKLPVKLGEIYKLEWTVPDVAVVNAFVNPDGTSIDFPDPDPAPQGETPARLEITVEKGPDEAHLTPDSFRKNRTPPFMSKKIVKTHKGEQTVKVFSATFKARQEGVFAFTVAGGPDKQSKTQTMFVRRTYRTIQEVIDDPAAVRRQAVLASIAEFFPAFNTWVADPSRGSQGKKKGNDSGIVGQGPWVASYEFDGKGKDTSCTTVNPFMMRTKHTKNNTSRWAFNAGPAEGPGSPAWVFCDKDHLPSVGDTYIVLNPFTAKQYGHVGIVLHVPPKGHGLWVMADGGQGGRPDQFAILVPRWGLMASELPAGGRPSGAYPDMVPEANGGPFLSGATQGDIDVSAPVPKDDEDVAGIIKRIQFRPTKPDHLTSCPRRLEGYVDVDHPVLKFSNVDGKPSTADVMTKCGELKTKVQNVIASFRAGNIVGGKGT